MSGTKIALSANKTNYRKGDLQVDTYLTLDPIFLEATPLLQTLKENGFEAYFVGGSVRDALLNKEIHDVDIATSAFPEEVKSLFPRTVDVGIEHGTVMVLFKEQSYEITTFRTESTYQDYRRPDSVTFVRSLEEDLKRRDFTINALAMDEYGRLIDLFDGKEDLDKKLIRAVGSPFERFNEDALRMMRAVRFQSQLDFTLEEKTFQAIKENHLLLSKIAVERIQAEFVKMMMGIGYSKGINGFVESKLYKQCPKLAGHKKALEKMAQLSEAPFTSTQMWTLLTYFMNLSPEQVEPFMREWKCSKAEMQRAKTSLYGLLDRLEKPPSKSLVYFTGLKISLEVECMLKLLNKPAQPETVKQLHEELAIHNRSELAVNGNDLIKQLEQKPGRWLGEIIEELEKQVVTDQLVNEEAALIEQAKKYLGQNRSGK